MRLPGTDGMRSPRLPVSGLLVVVNGADHHAVQQPGLGRPGDRCGRGDGGHVPYGVLVGVLLYLDLRAGKEQLSLETLRTELRAPTA
jgi:hypothetical protein